jgi:prophage regulatory protein
MQILFTFEDLVAAGFVANRVTLTRRIRRGEFPAPIRVGTRNVAWLKSEIEAWEAERVAERDSKRTASA